MPLINLPPPIPAPDPPLTAEVLAQLCADVSEWVAADSSTIDEGIAIVRRVREAGGPQALNLGLGATMALSAKIMQHARRAAARLADNLDDFQRRARAQERLDRLMRVMRFFSRTRVALLDWYDDTCKKRYAPGQAGAIDAAEEFAGAARGQKRPRDEAGPSQ